jgi:hypothetical protein
VADLEQLVQVDSEKMALAMELLRHWGYGARARAKRSGVSGALGIASRCGSPRAAMRRSSGRSDLQERMASRIGRLFPGCPPARAQQIAGHAVARRSGRVGRTAAGRALDLRAIELAVAASLRHQDTRYDELLMSGVGREAAREQVREHGSHRLDAWRSASEKDVAATPRS